MAEDIHYHEVELPDGTTAMTGPPIMEDQGGDAPVDAAGASPPPADPYKRAKAGGEREYVRDENGRFATTGAGGAANDTAHGATAASTAAEEIMKNPDYAAANTDVQVVSERVSMALDKATQAGADQGTLDDLAEADSILADVRRNLDVGDQGAMANAAEGLNQIADLLDASNSSLAEQAHSEKPASERFPTRGGTPRAGIDMRGRQHLFRKPKIAPDEKREYVRDENGRFATEGAAGAANTALEASTAANALASARPGSQEAVGRRRQLSAQVELASNRARSELGGSHPAVRELADIQTQVGRVAGKTPQDSAAKLRTIANRLGKVNEQLAAEVKQKPAGRGRGRYTLDPTAVPGHPPRYYDKPKPKSAPYEEEFVDETTQVVRAIGAQSLDALPEYGQHVYRSMYDSALRRLGKADDPGGLAFAQGVAWRAVAQAYGLPTSPEGKRFVDSGVKAIPGKPVASDGSFYVVAFSGARGAERYYDRIDNRTIPGTGGAVVRVGIGRPSNSKTILDVRVPKRLVDSTPGGSGAKTWVDRNLDVIRQVAWAEVSPLALINDNAVKSLCLTNCKFVTDMEKASERITYDIAYAPWEIDLQNQYATEAEVQKMAHAYMKHRGTNLMHVTGMKMPDGEAAGEVVESFIAPPGMKEFPRGSWVLGVRWHPSAWDRIKRGELTGYSIEGAWGVVPLHRVPELEAVA